MNEEKLPEVSLREGFSDRNNIKSVNTEIQYKDFHKRTRNAILNLSNQLFEVRSHYSYRDDFQNRFVKAFLTNV